MSDDKLKPEALSDKEAEAAFVALIEVLDGMGCAPAATVASKEDGGVSFSLHFSTDRARKLTAVWATRTIPESSDALLRVTLNDRIKQLRAERKRYFDVEGDGVDVLLIDIQHYFDRAALIQRSTDTGGVK